MVKNKKCFYVLLLALVLVVSLIGESPVAAQTTTLSLSPVTDVALTCTDTTIAVRVEDVTELIGYDIWLKFTPANYAVIEVWEVTNGDFLTEGYYPFREIDNVNGTIHIAMSQLSGPPVTGSGDLIYIRLRALVPDASFEIGFDEDAPEPTQLTNSSYDFIPFTSTDGTYTTADCEPANLYMNPTPLTLCVGYDFDIYVKVDNVLDLYAYDLDLTFTPGAVAISNVTNADFLSQGIFAPDNGFNNTLGTVNFSMTQAVEETNPPRDGSGNLIKITLQATEPDHTVVFNIADTSILASWSDYYSSAEIDYIATPGTYYTAVCDPTAVSVIDFKAQYAPEHASVNVSWETVSETDVVLIKLLRSENGSSQRDLIAEIFAEFPGQNVGHTYSYMDESVDLFTEYSYWLELVGTDPQIVGPANVFTGIRLFMPLLLR